MEYINNTTNQLNPDLKKKIHFWLTINADLYQFCSPTKRKLRRVIDCTVGRLFIADIPHQMTLSGKQQGVDLYTVYSPPPRNKWFTAYTFLKRGVSPYEQYYLTVRRASPQIQLYISSMYTGTMASSMLFILLGLCCQLVDASLESEMKKILPMVSKQPSWSSWKNSIKVWLYYNFTCHTL